MADSLTFEKISSYFHLPINEASRELKVCATILKKVCRASGIARWPHRKIRSLENMITQLKAQLELTSNEQERQRIQAEIFSFEEKKEYITRNPNTSYKSIVPKSTLQSFSKSKSKTNSSSSSSSKFEVTPKSEEEVLEVLTKLSQANYNHNNNNNNTYSDSVNNNINYSNNNSDIGFSGDISPKHKFLLPLKKEILKMEREKEKLKLLSQPNITMSTTFEEVIGQSNTHTPINLSHLLQEPSKLSIQSIVHQPIEKDNSTSSTSSSSSSPSSSANIQIISFDNNSKKEANLKKRKFEEFNDSVESLDEFRKFKESFPSLKYHRIWENDCSLVYISNHNVIN